MRKITIIGVLATSLLLAILSSCAAPQPNLSLEAQAQEIDRSLMCPLCPGQTIEQSQTELSQQMRSLVREKLAQGATQKEILQFFVERYGEGVLAAPTKAGFNLFLWLVPAIALGVGGFFLLRLIKAMQKRSATYNKPAPSLSEQERQYWEDRLKAELRKNRKIP